MGNQESTSKPPEPENIILNDRKLKKLPFTPSKESPIKNLYLSGNIFKTLPKYLKNVIMIDLTKNKLGPSLPIRISEALSTYTSLKQLYFTQNRLEDLNNLKNSSVSTIFLGQNRLYQLPDQFFANFPELQTIFIDCNFLKVLSNQSSNSIKGISLSLNGLHTLETSTLCFSQLISIDLSKNRIERIPNNFSKSFPNLIYLYLNDNFISEIPEIENENESVFPQTLNVLNLSNNLLEKVPNSITSLSKLSDLDIDGNKVTHLPKLNSSLVELKAQNNKIKSIENQELNFLKEFLIFNNELKTFPTEIKAIVNNSFIVDHNEITEINFNSVPINSVLSDKITVVDISFNQIETIPKEIFECLPNLQTFNAFFNKLTSIPSEIKNCKKLSDLNISNNPLKKLPKLPKSLYRFSASNCQIESFDDAFDENSDNANSDNNNEEVPVHLVLVDLSGNKLESFPTIPTIQILNLSQNRIKKMPFIAENMRILDLSMNELESTPESMPEFITGASIVDLNLSYNKLTKMPRFNGTPLLQYLELSENPIEGGFDISKFSFLERLDITQTNISITGKNEKLNELITSQTVKKPPKEDESQDHKQILNELFIKPLYINQENGKSGYSEFLGLRDSMEDSIIVRDDLNLYAVCDGHGGPNTEKFASIQIADLFEEGIQSNSFSFEKVVDFVSEKFRMAEKTIHKIGLQDGSTLCLAFVCKDESGKTKIVTAHLGDARAMIVRSNGDSRELTKDHKPSNRSEFERVHNNYGRVTRDNRIDGVLAVARAIGDYSIHGVGREPELNEFEIDENDKFLVICCDGVFDVLTNDDVAKIAVNASSASEAAFTIRNAAFGSMSCDNISAIVVDLTK